jgi:hypothetical protein
MPSSSDNRLTQTGVAAMRKSVLTTTRRLLAAGATSMLGVAMLAAPAAGSTSVCASSAGKCFAVTVSPSVPPSAPPAGGTVPFMFRVTNEASTQQIGSFQISAPANFVVTGASVLSSPGTASNTSSSALFVNLSVAPSASITVAVTAILPCSGSSYQWGMQVKQSNDFSGLPGNNFQLDRASAANLSGAPCGSCSLGFTSDGQPTGTAVSTAVSPAVITSGFGSTGGPVKVAVLDASGEPITNPAAIGPVAVTVAIPQDPNAPGKLLGTLTAQARAGVASFSDLSIDHSGTGYTLAATTTSPGIAASPPSDHFTIFGSLKSCSGRACSASLSSTTTTGTVTTSSVTSSGLLGAGIGGATYNCTLPDGTTYQSFSDPFSFDVFDSSGTADPSAQFSASLDISKSTVQSSGRSRAADWQVCYASTSKSFTPQPGTSGTATIGGTDFKTGLLPDCSATQGAPCVQSRAKANGDVIVTFLASGDPFGKG